MSELKQVGRLALRVEGDWWKAYYAMADSMEGALELGSIRLGLVVASPRKHAFMALMREVVADVIEEKTGLRPTWNAPAPGPEHERTGHGPQRTGRATH
jgi:hypothetical protein